jgi:protein-L-isoaspartate(D-aspartate) O-methyltransferase
MVSQQIEGRGVRDPEVLRAMRRVPRHEFVPADQREHAYEDRTLPIGEEQVISQPYVVAVMAEHARCTKESRVLEIGTGSGYHAAVLAELCGEVYSIEIVPRLARDARERLTRLGYASVHTREGDGYVGWPEHAPFDVILMTAAPPAIPKPLAEQLAMGGRFIAPVGTDRQKLRELTRTPSGLVEESLLDVRFVPMTGEVQKTEH